VDLYINSPILLDGVVLNFTFTFTLLLSCGKKFEPVVSCSVYRSVLLCLPHVLVLGQPNATAVSAEMKVAPFFC
jgi:hypothetical protein